MVVCRTCGTAASDVPASGIGGDAEVLFPDTVLSSWGICKKHMEK